MDSTHKDAQDTGYNDGRAKRRNSIDRRSYEAYSSLLSAYLRGYAQGAADRIAADKQEPTQ